MNAAATGGVPTHLAGFAEVEAQLQGPGSPFEVVREIVLGTEMSVFAQRFGSVRDIIAHSASHGDSEFMVWDTGQRITFADHVAAVAAVAKRLFDCLLYTSPSPRDRG